VVLTGQIKAHFQESPGKDAGEKGGFGRVKRQGFAFSIFVNIGALT
jgi:hypothetical protein